MRVLEIALVSNKKIQKFDVYLKFILGLRFGLLQVLVGLAAILKKYEFSVNQKTGNLVLNPSSFILSTMNTIWLDVKRREQEE